MSQKTIIFCSTLFVVLVAGMFTYAYLKRAELSDLDPLMPAVATTTPYGITRIDGKHFFINGVHTIVGEISLPTPCDLLTTNARVAESMPEQVTFLFSVLNNSEACAQVVTAARFKVSANASEMASLSASFMGSSVDLNLVEASLGETPESFELFIKG